MKDNKLDLPIDVEKKKKTLLTVKIIILILTSNLLTYLLCTPSFPSIAQNISDTPNHLKILIPLKVLFTLSPSSKTLATIIDQNNHVIFKKVYIQSTSSIDSTQKNAYTLEENSEEIKKFHVEVPRNESTKIKNYKDKILFALPYNHQEENDPLPKPEKSLEFNI